MFSISDLYTAYRKAKSDAFYNRNIVMGMRFAEYEKRLAWNLGKLVRSLNKYESDWSTDLHFIGKCHVIPKKLLIDNEAWNASLKDSDPSTEWSNYCRGKEPIPAELRYVLDPTVDYLVVCTLWGMIVGAKLDEGLDNRQVYANRTSKRNWSGEINSHGYINNLNLDSRSLFKSYQGQYRAWLKDSIKACESGINSEKSLVAVSLDVKSCYDNIDAASILDERLLTKLGVVLSESDRKFTKQIIVSIYAWNAKYKGNQVGLPIGIQAFGIINNCILSQMDYELSTELETLFYGRYVDDVFLCFKSDVKFTKISSIQKHISMKAKSIKLADESMSYKWKGDGDTKIEFNRDKMKIFMLKGETGFDMLRPIEESLSKQASRHRLLPYIPETKSELADRLMILSSKSNVVASAFRHMDNVQLKKAEFSRLLIDLKAYSKLINVKDERWGDVRKCFYEIINERVLTPNGFFEFYDYVPEIVKVMVQCGDWNALYRYLQRLKRLRVIISRTVALEKECVDWMFQDLSTRILEAMLGCKKSLMPQAQLVSAVAKVHGLGRLDISGVTRSWVQRASTDLAEADWIEEPFYDRVVSVLEDDKGKIPRLDLRTAKVLRVSTIKEFVRKAYGCDIGRKAYRGLFFPTRKMSISAITENLSDEAIMEDARGQISPNHKLSGLYRYNLALTGRRMLLSHIPQPLIENDIFRGFLLQRSTGGSKAIALTCFQGDDESFEKSLLGHSSVSFGKLQDIFGALNNVLNAKSRIDYIVFPELFLARSILPYVEFAFVRSGMSPVGTSIVGGVEYIHRHTGSVENTAVVCLALGRYHGAVRRFHRKFSPSWGEGRRIVKANKQFDGSLHRRLVYGDMSFCFGVLICSDLTNVEFRADFAGRVDALFVPEWNQDTASFSPIVESASGDLHAFIVQCNVRQYGDCRIRGPFRAEYKRDLVRIKGGNVDYFVVADMPVKELRNCHKSPPHEHINETQSTGENVFKPFPTNFRYSDWRK